MALETGNYICDLVETNPPGTDNVSQGDDHLRLIKHVLLTQFPNLCGEAVTVTAADMNTLPVPAPEDLIPVNAGASPLVNVNLSANNFTKILWDSIQYDTNDQFTPGTGEFTCKQDGVYSGAGMLSCGSLTDQATYNAHLYLDGVSLRPLFGVDAPKDNVDMEEPFSFHIPLLAGQKLDIRVRVEQTGKSVRTDSYWGMALLR